MNLTSITQNPTMSSREIAELTEKEHRNVMADIRKMLDELGLTTADFSAVVAVDTGNGTVREFPTFNLPKRECLILVSGYSVVLRAKIIDRWEALESGRVKPVAASIPAAKPLLPTEIKTQAEAMLAVLTSEGLKRNAPLVWQELTDGVQNAMRAALGSVAQLPAPDTSIKPLDIMEIAKASALHVPQKLRSSVGKYVKARSTMGPVVVERLINGSIRTANAYTNHAEVAGLVQAFLATQASD